MTLYEDRSGAERALVNALSRHVGYTSAAYDLSRILSVVDFFSDRPSGLDEEIKSFLKEERSIADLTDEYLAEVLNFTTAFGLVELVGTKHRRLQSYTLTQTGRALLAIRNIGSPDLERFVASKLVLLADADFVVPLMIHMEQDVEEAIQDYFLRFLTDLYYRRLVWLAGVFEERVLYDRVAQALTWTKKDLAAPKRFQVLKLTRNTARHHVTPRRGWLKELEWIDAMEGTLTPFGRRIYDRLVPKGRYFWLGPSTEALKTLGISRSAVPDGPTEDSILVDTENVKEPSEDECDEIANDVREIMLNGFSQAKLVYSRQATLMFPIMYIEYRSYVDDRKYDWEAVLERVFRKFKDSVERLSARVGRVGFYRVK